MRRYGQRINKAKNGTKTRKAELEYRNEVTKEKAKRRTKEEGTRRLTKKGRVTTKGKIKKYIK
jgi:hypothetical protein